MSTIHFHDWARTPLLASATAQAGARLDAEIRVRLVERAAGGAAREQIVSVPVTLASFADVRGLGAGAITRRYPAPNVTDAEPSRLALIEFADVALPWAYTPRLPDDVANRPWCVLLVGRSASAEAPGDLEIRELDGNKEVTLASDYVRTLPPLSRAHLWGHVQVLDGSMTGRLVAPFALAAHTAYTAVLVPSWRLVEDAVVDAWEAESADAVVLPVLDRWDFRTGEEDDFLALALALRPGTAPADLGRFPLRYARLPLEPRLETRGALEAIASTDPAPPSGLDPWPPTRIASPAISADVARLRAFVASGERDDQGRPILTLPVYGQPWNATTLSPWGETINADPRQRGVAGLGSLLSIREQEKLVDLVVERLGAFREAEQRLRYLAFGISAARSLWRRRLPQTPGERIMLLGLAMPRLLTPAGSLADVVAGPGRSLARGLFTSAARRALRPGPARAALAHASATDPARLLEAANRCPPIPPDPAGLPIAHPGPLDPRRPIDPVVVADAADPSSVEQASDAPRMDKLRAAVTRLAEGTPRWSPSVSNETWHRPSSPIPLSISWQEPGPLEGMRQRSASVRVALTGITEGRKDRIGLVATTLPSIGPRSWTLDVNVVGGPSLQLSSEAPDGELALGEFGNRTPRVELVLRPRERPDLQRSASAIVELAPLSFSFQGASLRLHDSAVAVELQATIHNLANAATTVSSGAFADGQGTTFPLLGPVPLGPKATTTVTQQIMVAPGDAPTISLRLTIGTQATPAVEIEPPRNVQTSLVDAPWLVPFVLAVTSASGGTPEARRTWDEGMRGWVDHVANRGLETWREALAGTDLEGLTEADIGQLLGELAHRGPPSSPFRPCRPVDLARLDQTLTAAFDPTLDSARAIERVTSTITGRPPDAGLEPIGACPDVPLPVWELLRIHGREWLLPGLGGVEKSSVIGLKTNPEFLESVLVGTNQQLLAELVWRGIPLHPRCSPLRSFWGRRDPATDEHRPDIRLIAGWGDTPFTDPSHREGEGEALVVLLRTELFRRYPATVVYLLPAGDPLAPDFTAPDRHHGLPRVYPDFQGTLGDDAAFFGFSSVEAERGGGYWFVIEEPERGFRFWSTKAGRDGSVDRVLDHALSTAATGGQFAQTTFADPIRIMIRGDELVRPPGSTT